MDDTLPLPAGHPDLAIPDDLQADLQAAMDLAHASVAESTAAAYARAFNRFAVWAEGHGLPALPATPDAVAAYLGLLHRRKLSPSRLAVVLAAISWRHKRDSLPDPTRDERLAMVMAGKRRQDAGRPKRKAKPLLAKGDGGLPGDLHRLVAAIEGDDLVARRDRAMILLGFAGAFRRSELAALRLSDLDWTPRGLLVTVRRSKGDQEGKGQRKAILPGSLHCPLRALRDWLAALEAATGREASAGAAGAPALPVFVAFGHPRGSAAAGAAIPVPKAGPMSDQTVARVLKARAAAAGLDAASISGHSLRSGFVTSAALEGRDVLKIRAQTGHRTVQMVAEYAQIAEVFEDNPGDGLL